jgi:hypothetical protein
MKSKDSSHVLHADVVEVPQERPVEEALTANPGFRDLDAEAHVKGLFAMEREFLPLLVDQSCPRCHQSGKLELSQLWTVGQHKRY